MHLGEHDSAVCDKGNVCDFILPLMGGRGCVVASEKCTFRVLIWRSVRSDGFNGVPDTLQLPTADWMLAVEGEQLPLLKEHRLWEDIVRCSGTDGGVCIRLTDAMSMYAVGPPPSDSALHSKKTWSFSSSSSELVLDWGRRGAVEPADEVVLALRWLG